MARTPKKYIFILTATMLCMLSSIGCFGCADASDSSLGDAPTGSQTPPDAVLPSDCTHVPTLTWESDGAKHWRTCLFCLQPLNEAPHDVTGITLTTPPDKTSYEEGTSFQSAGMVISATCNVCGEVASLTGYTVTGGRSLKLTTTHVTVEYAHLTVQVPIEVKPYGGGNWTPEVEL